MDPSGSDQGASSSSTGSTKRQAPSAAAPRKKRAVKREPSFPSEIWEQIFGFFAGQQLLQLRLVCQRWNGVISASSMLACRFHIRFRNLKNIDAEYTPVNLPPLVARAAFSGCTIDAVDSWWPKFGQQLSHLTIDGGTIGMQTLFGMLQQTANLRTLKLSDVTISDSVERTFRLSRLDKLDIHRLRYTSEQHVDILDGFERFFPCLKHLSLDVQNRKLEDILQSIRILQRNLQSIELHGLGGNILSELCEMNDLRLRKVPYNVELPRELELWTRFCQNQCMVEELRITVESGAVLRDTGAAMPRLKRLRLTLSSDGTVVATFLETMKALEYLEISSDGIPELHLSGQSSPNLEEIYLGGLICPDLDQYLQHSPVVDTSYNPGRRKAIKLFVTKNQAVN